MPEAPLIYWPELQLGIMQLEREGSPPPGLRLPQAKLSRKSNQVARGRIRRFESYMPSQSVRSLWAASLARFRFEQENWNKAVVYDLLFRAAAGAAEDPRARSSHWKHL